MTPRPYSPTFAGVGEAYKCAAAQVRSDVAFIHFLGRCQDPHGHLTATEVLNAVTMMDTDVSFKLFSIELNYTKVLGVLASALVAVLFTLGPRLLPK